MAKTNSARNGTIDFMKFCFTMMVMLYHTTWLFSGGYIAVDFFFLVSGFLMAQSMEKRLTNNMPLGLDTVHFILHKAKGIFPYYFAAWVLSFAVGQYISGATAVENWLKLLRSPYNIFMATMTGHYDMGHRIQGSWYISAMIIAMFMIYPVRKKFTNIYDYVIAPIIFLLFVGMAYQTGRGVSGFTVGYLSDLRIFNGLVRGIADLSLGMTCYRLTGALRKLDFTLYGRFLITAVQATGFILVFYIVSNYKESDIDLSLILILAVCISFAFSGKGLLCRIMDNRLFNFLGSFSLQMYLTHEMVKNVIIPYLRDTLGIAFLHGIPRNTYLCYYILGTIFAAISCRLLGYVFLKSAGPLARGAAALILKKNQL